jgi:starch synthase
LTQLAALRYGALPVVSRVGGLADSVVDASDANVASGSATGLQFFPVTREQLESALERAHGLWRERRLWRRLQARAMHADVGWSASAKHYADLFRDVVGACQS